MPGLSKNNTHVPSWRRLGLKLKHAQEAPADGVEDSGSATRREKAENGSYLKSRASLAGSTGPSRNQDGKHAMEERSSSGKRGFEDEPSNGGTKSKKRRLHEAEAVGHVAKVNLVPGETVSAPGDKSLLKKERKKKKASPAISSDTGVTRSPPVGDRVTASKPSHTSFNTNNSAHSLTRRKSVTFAPDTKKQDGDSGQRLARLFLQQPGQSSKPELQTSEAEIEPRRRSETNSEESKKSKKSKQDQNGAAVSLAIEDAPKQDEATDKQSKLELKRAKRAARAQVKPAVPQPTPAYLTYLTEYHTSRDSWKFNKGKQNDLLKHLFDLYKVPEGYNPAIRAYLLGLQGAARGRLADTARRAFNDTNEDEALAHKRNRAQMVLEVLGKSNGDMTIQVENEAQATNKLKTMMDGKPEKRNRRLRKIRTGAPSHEVSGSSSDESTSSATERSSDSESESEESEETGSGSDGSSTVSSSSGTSESEDSISSSDSDATSPEDSD